MVVHAFTRAADHGAGNPSGPLVQDAEGNFYGTLGTGGGHARRGAVFRMNPAGAIKLLHVFADHGDGAYPDALVIGRNVLYGTTAYTGGTYGGTLFSLTRGGKFNVLHTFDCASSGCQPYGRLVLDADGVLFGAAPLGGTDGVGTVYRWKRGAFSIIHDFIDNDPLGSIPQGGLEIDEHGRLFGTTEFGGRQGAGVIFEMNRDGTGRVLHAFGDTDQDEGVYPVSAPTLCPGGQLYGNTLQGGQGRAGEGNPSQRQA